MTTIGTETVTRVPYTVVSAIASRSTEVLTMPDVLPIVFVVDDDLSVVCASDACHDGEAEPGPVGA